MKRIYSALILISISAACFAQDFSTKFNKYFQDGDTLKLKEVLVEWEKQNPNDAELFTSYFNYFVLKSKQEFISMTTEEPQGDSFIIKDSLHNVAGYITGKTMYNDAILKQGLAKIDQGIKLYPDRLDMRFGKIYILGEVKNWDLFTKEILKAIDYSNQNNNQWTWTNNQKQSNGQDFFLNALQDYQIQLYNSGDDNYINNMRDIASEVLKFYPNDVENLSNLSITYLLTDEYEKAIELLEKAEQIAPKDPIILGNLALAYKQKGEKTKAIEYYRKTIKYADKNTIQYAQQQIEELKNSTDN